MPGLNKPFSCYCTIFLGTMHPLGYIVPVCLPSDGTHNIPDDGPCHLRQTLFSLSLRMASMGAAGTAPVARKQATASDMA